MLADNGAHGTPNGVRTVSRLAINMELLTEFGPEFRMSKLNLNFPLGLR